MVMAGRGACWADGGGVGKGKDLLVSLRRRMPWDRVRLQQTPHSALPTAHMVLLSPACPSGCEPTPAYGTGREPSIPTNHIPYCTHLHARLFQEALVDALAHHRHLDRALGVVVQLLCTADRVRWMSYSMYDGELV